MRKRTLIIELIMLGLIQLSASCGGPGASTPGGDQPQPPAAAGLRLPAPAELLKLASTTDSERINPGLYYSSALPNNLVVPGGWDDAYFSPSWTPGADGAVAGIAYAIYPFSGFDSYSGDPRLFTNWQDVDMSLLWIGIANFDRGRWDWYNSPVDPEINMPEMSPYVAPDGRAFVCVMLLGTEVAQLNWIVLGDPLPPDADMANDLPSDKMQRLAPLTVHFTAAGSQSWGSQIVLYEMDYEGDGAYDDSSQSPIEFTHVFAAGNYNPTLRVTDSYGQSDTADYPLHVINPANMAPTAQFTPLIVTNNAPLTVNFDASGSSDPDGSIVSYAWDFDADGKTDYSSATPSATYTFCQEGSNNVTLTITDNDLATATAFGQVVCNNGWRHSAVAPLGAFLKDRVGLVVQGSGASARACVSFVDNAQSVLRFVRGNDNIGLTWGNVVNVESGGDSHYAKGSTSLQIESLTQTPMIAYGMAGKSGNQDELRFVRATNMTGSSWNASVTVRSGQGTGNDCDLLQSGGKLLIAEAVSEGFPGGSALRVHQSSDSLGTGWALAKVVQASIPGVGIHSPALIAVPGLSPLLAWAQRDTQSFDVPSYWCSNATTAAGGDWTSPLSIPAGEALREFELALVVSGGRPCLAMGGAGQGSKLWFNRANDFQGADWPSEPVCLDDPGWVGQSVSAAIVNGRPAIAYADFTTSSVRYIQAADANGASWNAAQIVDSAGLVGSYCALALLPNDIPIIVYQDLENDIVKAAVFY